MGAMDGGCCAIKPAVQRASFRGTNYNTKTNQNHKAPVRLDQPAKVISYYNEKVKLEQEKKEQKNVPKSSLLQSKESEFLFVRRENELCSSSYEIFNNTSSRDSSMFDLIYLQS
eukprot:TRINITY_DN56810_c0_g1_i1.p2 TRINITY_DN56810_c0_g1~~TRINITY_DN56810_c0_g1_i1.p2  ORF type:complete len:114 (+),score=10.35 TRINITY_DN56810_c0_g1_i1:2-343(+)